MMASQRAAAGRSGVRTGRVASFGILTILFLWGFVVASSSAAGRNVEELANELAELQRQAGHLMDELRSFSPEGAEGRVISKEDQAEHRKQLPPSPPRARKRIWFQEEIVMDPVEDQVDFWHREGEDSGTHRELVEEKPPVGQRLVQFVREKGSNVAARMKGAVEKGENVLHKVEAKGKELVEEAKETLGDVGAAVKEKVVRAIKQGENILHSASQEGKHIADAAKEKGQQLLRTTEEGIQKALEREDDIVGGLKESAEGWTRAAQTLWGRIRTSLFGIPREEARRVAPAALLPPREVGQKFLFTSSPPVGGPSLLHTVLQSEHERIDIHTTIDLTHPQTQ